MVSYFNLKEKENTTLLSGLCTCFFVIQPESVMFTYPLFHSCFTHINSKTHIQITRWSLAVPLEEYPFPKISMERSLWSDFYLVSLKPACWVMGKSCTVTSYCLKNTLTKEQKLGMHSVSYAFS